MDTLAGYGSSSSDNESVDQVRMIDYADSSDEDDTKIINNDSKINTTSMQTTETNHVQQNPDDLNSKSYELPKPILCSDSDTMNGFDALITFSKDYLHNHLAPVKVGPIKPKLQQRLESMYKSFGESNDKTFAEHLRSQKEFNNPHFFSEVIAHFNIDANGSNFPSHLYGGYEDFEDADRIIAKEEQARVAMIQRKQQQMNGNSLALNIPMNS